MRGVAATGLVVFVALAFGAAASAAPERPAATGSSVAVAGNPARAAAVDGRTDLTSRDPADDLPSLDTGGQATVALATSGRISRAKLQIEIPVLRFVALVFSSTRPGFPLFPAPAGFLPKRPNPACNYYNFRSFTDLYAADIDQLNLSEPGTLRSVGRFPDVRVSLVAFGSIPVTAVLHVQQVRRGGRIQPIYADQLGVSVSLRKDDQQTPASPQNCDPAYDSAPRRPTLATGDVEARISDVRIDGRLLDVGPVCRASTPLRLNLQGEPTEYGGQYDNPVFAGTLYQRRDRTTINPANPLALYPGSTNLAIPPFVGCRGASGDDLSPLVTGMISGPDNTLAANQTDAVTYTSDEPFDPDHPDLCDSNDICLQVPRHVRPPVPGK